MELIGYVRSDWTPFIRPAPSKRDWMDATPDAFAYRCLPLTMANAHGWEILAPCGFEAIWDGGATTDAVRIALDADTRDCFLPVSLFGGGVLTFHVEALFRTPPGWNLWVTGPPNLPKDGIAALTGLIETDWSPYTFTMNWQFTRPGHRIRFERGEPFCFFFPVERAAIERFEPRLMPLGDAPDVERQFEDWRESRLAFHEKMATDRPAARSDSWQKNYYRGDNPDGTPGASDHQQKLRVKPFPNADGRRHGKR
jgi:hypothetical protein